MSEEHPNLSNGRYTVERCIGKGGMAAVFLAWDNNLQLPRAIKLLHPSLLLNNSVRSRFTKEALAMAQLDHPNIIHVYDHGLEGMTLYIVMEYVKGSSLQNYLNQHGTLSLEEAARATLEIARGLEYSHQKGYLHRDIKPDNMLIAENGLKLTDFGLVQVPDMRQTQTKAIMGTPAYMPPEQRISAKKVSAQSDIYSLVASFYVMLSNDDPQELFEEEERIGAIALLAEEAQDIIHKGCQADPQKRYGSVGELIWELEQILKGVTLNPLPVADSAPTFSDDLQTIWSQYVTTISSEEKAKKDAKISSAETLLLDEELGNNVVPLPSQQTQEKEDAVKETNLKEKMRKPEVSSGKKAPMLQIIAGIVLIILFIGYILLPKAPETTELPSAIRIVKQEIPTKEYFFLTDKADLLIAVTLEKTDKNKDEYSIFTGSGNKLFGIPYISASKNGTEAWSFGFWDSRYQSGYQRQIMMKDSGEEYWLQCGEKEDRKQLFLVEKDANNFEWYLPKWERKVEFLAQDSEMNYYYLDSLRYSDEFSMPHFFIGEKGSMRHLPIEDITQEYLKYSIKTAEGIFQIDGDSGSWRPTGGEGSQVKKLDTWSQARMIYTELGVYADEGLGTPCDTAWGGNSSN